MLLHYVTHPDPQTPAPPSTPDTHTARPSWRPSTLHPQSRAQDMLCLHTFLLSFLSPEREGQGFPPPVTPPHTLNH